MSIWNFLKPHATAQFLDLVEWVDDSNDTLVWRFPVFNKAITDKSKLVVREGQAAVFVSEGKISEVFGPGTHNLDTKNIPILAFFQSIAYQFNYPYKGDIYFLSTRQFLDQTWGTTGPIMMRDPEFGAVRIRAHGVFGYQVTDASTFLREIVGTDGLFTTDEINGQLKKKLVAALAETLGESDIPILDLAAQYMNFGEVLVQKISPVFHEGYGLTLTDFTIGNITLPETVEEALDARTKMGVLGNLDAYTQMQVADSVSDAAKNPGIGGAGVGMGVGFGMGNQMSHMMASSQGGGTFDPHTGLQSGDTAPSYHYKGSGDQEELAATDVARRIAADRSGKHMVWQPGWEEWKTWSEVAELAGLVPPKIEEPPPLPDAHGDEWHYSGPDGTDELSADEIRAKVSAAPDAKHHVWKKGWEGWRAVAEVPELASLDDEEPPPPPPS